MFEYGTTTPLNKQTITKNNGKRLLMTVKLGAHAQIHWPQLAMNKKNSSVIKNTYPAAGASYGRPVGRYHSSQYTTPATNDPGISLSTSAVQNATQPYTRLGCSRASHSARFE